MRSTWKQAGLFTILRPHPTILKLYTVNIRFTTTYWNFATIMNGFLLERDVIKTLILYLYGS